MNLPNRLTVLRIFLVIPFFILMVLACISKESLLYSGNTQRMYYFIAGGIIFLLAMITDFVDGHIARKTNSVTTFGKLFDPLADKIMTTTALIFLSVLGASIYYLLFIFILRDILVDGFRNLAAANNKKVAASWVGKWKTLLQSFGIVLIFFVYPISLKFGNANFSNLTYYLALLNIPLFIAAILSIISGYVYFKNIKNLLITS